MYVARFPRKFLQIDFGKEAGSPWLLDRQAKCISDSAPIVKALPKDKGVGES